MKNEEVKIVNLLTLTQAIVIVLLVGFCAFEVRVIKNLVEKTNSQLEELRKDCVPL